ncbi:MAG: hypothetical protein NTW60_02730 [Candidatus Wolfebacteria bacterium]|nr:hypothetical protein [Candidatus Wolfebacteria bacterium]
MLPSELLEPDTVTCSPWLKSFADPAVDLRIEAEEGTRIILELPSRSWTSCGTCPA